MRLYWMRVGLDPLTIVLTRGEQSKQTGEKVTWRPRQGWRDAAAVQGTPRLATALRSWRKDVEQIFPQSPQQEPTCCPLDFGLLASRTVREYVSVAFSHLVCGNLLLCFQKTNAEGIATPIFTECSK